jgi:hypothetical protein
MKVLGFVIVVLGIVLGYVGITGSQHRLMSIITKKPALPSGAGINPSGSANVPASTTTNSTASSGASGSGAGSVALV